MPQRRKAPLEKTYLCAVKFWRSAPTVPTMASGVRHVVREQDYASKDIYGVEKTLERRGLLKVSGSAPKTVRLTSKGERQASCRSVKLTPWTNTGYPGSQLEATPPTMTPAQSRKRIRELRRQGCKVTTHRVRGMNVVLKECPKRRKK